MEIDRFALFELFSKLTPDNLKVKILYKKGELLAPQRNKLHRLLRQDLGVANEIINKKIFFKSRHLFNLSYEWEMFKPSSDYLRHELTELAHEFYPAPKEMIIAINNVCNLQCVMCDLHNPKLQKTIKMIFLKNANIWRQKKSMKPLIMQVTMVCIWLI